MPGVCKGGYEIDIVIPVGYIMPWGNKEKIPDGWQIANGHNGTKDFRNIPVYLNPSGSGTQTPIEGVWIQKVTNNNDNDWKDDLHLGDVIDKHLADHLYRGEG